MLPSLMSRTRHRALLALAISGCSLAPFTIAQAADAGDNASDGAGINECCKQYVSFNPDIGSAGDQSGICQRP